MKYEETSTIELKREYTNTYLRSVSAFATYTGGKVYFGIDEKSGVVCGIDNPNDVKLSIENSIHDSISPRPDYSLETIEMEGKDVIVLSVSAGVNGPYFYKSKVYHRADTSSAPIERSEVRKLIMDAEDVGYEDLESTQSDLEFNVLRRRLEDIVGIEGFNKDVLRTLGLYKNGVYNRAAQLLADENEIKSSYIDMVRFGETESIFLERKTIRDCSLLTQYEEAMNFFDRWYHPYEEIAGAYRNTRIYIPKDGFREALANSIINRDFMINSFIRIAMYEDRIEINSPGSLPKGISEKDFLAGKVSVPRNKIIAAVFNRLDIIEMFATGIKRIRAQYEPFKVKPIFEISENYIRVVLPKISYNDKLYTAIYTNGNEAGVVEEDAEVTGGVTGENIGVTGEDAEVTGGVTGEDAEVTGGVTGEEQRILEVLIEEPFLSYETLSERLSLSRKTVAKHIKALRNKNKIERVGGSGRNGYWKELK